MELLRTAELTKIYDNVPALNNLSITVERGKVIGLLGPNGSGKTTLIKLIAGILTPSSGELYINGVEPGPQAANYISYLPERTYLVSWMRVRDIIDYFSDFYSDFDSNKAYEMLSRLNIKPDDRLKTMSKGTKEKVQLILVMSRRADLYLLDEPIAGVDPAARDYIMDTIISNYRENSSVIISTHLIYDIESTLDEVIMLSYGNLFMQDSADGLRNKYGKSIDMIFREAFRC